MEVKPGVNKTNYTRNMKMSTTFFFTIKKPNTFGAWQDFFPTAFTSTVKHKSELHRSGKYANVETLGREDIAGSKM